MSRLVNLSELTVIARGVKSAGGLLMASSGVFDGPQHLGHFEHILKCQGMFPEAVFMLLVCNNRSVRWRKGHNRPFVDELDRASSVTEMGIADYVAIDPAEEEDGVVHESAIRALGIDHWIVPDDSSDNILHQRKKIAAEMEINLVIVERKPPALLGRPISTSQIASVLAEGRINFKTRPSFRERLVVRRHPR